jgi:hypothetical protein
MITNDCHPESNSDNLAVSVLNTAVQIDEIPIILASVFRILLEELSNSDNEDVS